MPARDGDLGDPLCRPDDGRQGTDNHTHVTGVNAVEDEIRNCAQGASPSLGGGYSDATESDTVEHKESAALVDDAGVSVQPGKLEVV